MKRRALLGHLQEHGCVPHREGGGHSIWINPQTGSMERTITISTTGGLSVKSPPFIEDIALRVLRR